MHVPLFASIFASIYVAGTARGNMMHVMQCLVISTNIYIYYIYMLHKYT